MGLRLGSFPGGRRFIFPYRKSGGDLLSGRTRDLVFRSIRPDGNRWRATRRPRDEPRDGRGRMKTLVRMQFGSHVYGTNVPTSDHDFKAIHLPEGRDILLQRRRTLST